MFLIEPLLDYRVIFGCPGRQAIRLPGCLLEVDVNCILHIFVNGNSCLVSLLLDAVKQSLRPVLFLSVVACITFGHQTNDAKATITLTLMANSKYTISGITLDVFP